MSALPVTRSGTARSGLSIQSILLIMLLAVSIISNVVVGVIGYVNGTESLRTAALDRLTEVRDSRAREVTSLFDEVRNSLTLASRDAEVADAVQEFSAAFDELDVQPKSSADAAIVSSLLESGAEDSQISTSLLTPQGAAATYLIARYGAADDPVTVDDAQDGSSWSAANAEHHDYFRAMAQLFGYADVVLIDDSNRIVYSVDKGIDLGASLGGGVWGASGLTEAVAAARQGSIVDSVAVSDFAPYPGAFGLPVGWAAVPLDIDGRYVGSLAVRLPEQRIDDIMSGDGKWEESGLGRTGEAYLVGSDSLMRSGSRELVENPSSYAVRATAGGVPESDAAAIVSSGTTLLTQPVRTDAVAEALLGRTGTTTATGYLGGETIAAYAPLSLAGLRWAVVAQLDSSEALQPVRDFTVRLALSSAILVAIVSIASVIIAQLVVRPLRRLRDAARKIAAGETGVVVDAGSSDELADVATAFNDMSHSLELKAQLIEEQKAENERLLALLMPSSIAERYRQGDENIVEEHRDVTVLFADIVGFEHYSRTVSQEQALDLLNDIVRSFDEAAEAAGVERVRTTRQGYFASCGLAVPRVDHTRRMVEFAVEMRRIVARFGSRTGVPLELRAGIDSGTVSSGLVGRSHVLYDLWGDAVNLAFRLQSEVRESGVFISDRVAERLPETSGLVESGELQSDGGAVRVWRVDTEGAGV